MIVKLIVVVFLIVPLESEPVMVNVTGPPGFAVGLTFSVRVELADEFPEPFAVKLT